MQIYTIFFTVQQYFFNTKANRIIFNDLGAP